MAQRPFTVQQLRIVDYAEKNGVDILTGSAVPGGDSGDQDAAAIGSLYLRDNGQSYIKDANVGAATDWVQQVDEERLASLLGISEGDADLGVFSGMTISDNTDVKTALQELETAIENVSGGAEVEETGVTTSQVIDSVLVDNIDWVEWEVVAFEEATPANKCFFKIAALHDGTASADAANTDFSVSSILSTGAAFDFTYDITLSGSAGSQNMNFTAASTTAGITVKTRRTSVG